MTIDKSERNESELLFSVDSLNSNFFEFKYLEKIRESLHSKKGIRHVKQNKTKQNTH